MVAENAEAADFSFRRDLVDDAGNGGAVAEDVRAVSRRGGDLEAIVLEGKVIGQLQTVEERMRRFDAGIEYGDFNAATCALSQKGARLFKRGPGNHRLSGSPPDSAAQKAVFDELREERGGSLDAGKMVWFEAGRIRRARAGVFQLDAGNDAATGLQKIKGNGDHGPGLHVEHGIEHLALFGVLPNLVFEEGLFGRENHADEAGVEGLFELADEFIGIRASVVGRNEIFAGLIHEPDGAFVRAGLDEALAQDLAHEGIENIREFFGMNAGADSEQPIVKDRLQLLESGLGQDVQGLAHEDFGFWGGINFQRRCVTF